ncbi:MAG: hypothetical protein ACYDHX_07805 [Methanothrix sp.]
MGHPSDDILSVEWKPSARSVVSCGVCRPPEDVGENHRSLPGLPPLTDMSKFGRK